MNTASSYAVSTFAVDTQREIRRLQAQVELFWPQESILYRNLGLSPGMRVLDCGCGPGHLLERLIRLYPSLDCVGIEPDPLLAGIAEESLVGTGQFKIYRQSITQMELPDDTFDLVIVRLVLEHLPDPAAALKEVRRVLKPGGGTVVIDNDFDFHERTWPETPELDALYRAYCRARRAEGGNPCIGRELPGLLRRAGFGSVELHVLAAHNEIAGDDVFRRAEGAGIPAQLVRTGYLEPGSLDRVTKQWIEALSTENHAICRILFAGVGKKSTDAKTEAAAAPRSISQLDSGSEAGLGLETLSPEALKKFIQTTLALETGMPPDAFPVDTPLVSAGTDSLAALGLCNRLSSRFGTKLSVADVLSGSTISEIATKVITDSRCRPDEQAVIPVQPRA